MIRSLAIFLLLSSCDSCLPAGCPATPKSGFERMAAAHLQVCREGARAIPSQQAQCFEESAARCIDAGYSPKCGQGESEWTYGDKAH